MAPLVLLVTVGGAVLATRATSTAPPPARAAAAASGTTTTHSPTAALPTAGMPTADAPTPGPPPSRPAPAAAVPATTAPAGPLGGPVQAYLATRSGDVTAAVEDIPTGQTWTLRPGEPQATASIVKVDIMAALLARAGAGGQPLPAGEASLLGPMIEQSDNDAASSLWQAAGGPSGIAAFNARVGMSQTSPSPCLTCAGFPWPGWGLTTTTATDQLALLRHLVLPNPELAADTRAGALALMENVDPSERWGVSTGVPPGSTVALKNGWVPLQDGLWQMNSIGWVSGAGRDYLIAVLDRGNPTEGYGIETLDTVSAMVWDALAP